MTEPASVVAARQLADEARHRRVPLPRRVRNRRVRAALLATGALGSAGCAVGPDTACALVYYSPVLRVVLGESWPEGVDRVVEVECQGCDPAALDGPGVVTATVGADGTAELGLPVHAAQVTVRVLEAGVVVAESITEPDYRSIDGTRECPGPTEAEIQVSAP